MSELILAIDPGDVMSAYAVIEPGSCCPLRFAKVPNADLLAELAAGGFGADQCVIEMISNYGSVVGSEVFATCMWIGKFADRWSTTHYDSDAKLVFRTDAKLHVTGKRGAKDSEVVRSLCDRFAWGQPNYGKGTKAEPGFFYGFKADVWQAYALAVAYSDYLEGTAPRIKPLPA